MPIKPAQFETFARFQDPIGQGITRKELDNILFTCHWCGRTFARTVRDIHFSYCDEEIEVIEIKDDEDDEEANK